MGYLNQNLLKQFGNVNTLASPAVVNSSIAGLSAAGIAKLIQDTKRNNNTNTYQPPSINKNVSSAPLLTRVDGKYRSLVRRISDDPWKQGVLGTLLRIAENTGMSTSTTSGSGGPSIKDRMFGAQSKFSPIAQLADWALTGKMPPAVQKAYGLNKSKVDKIKSESEKISAASGMSTSDAQLFTHGYARRVMSGTGNLPTIQTRIQGSILQVAILMARNLDAMRQAMGVETLPTYGRKLRQDESWLGKMAKGTGDLPGINALKNLTTLTATLINFPFKQMASLGKFADTLVNKFKGFFSGGLFGAQTDSERAEKSGRKTYDYVRDGGLGGALNSISFILEKEHEVSLRQLSMLEVIANRSTNKDSLTALNKRGALQYDVTSGTSITQQALGRVYSSMDRDIYAKSAWGKVRLAAGSMRHPGRAWNRNAEQQDAWEKQYALNARMKTSNIRGDISSELGKDDNENRRLLLEELGLNPQAKISIKELTRRVAIKRTRERYNQPETQVSGIGGINTIRGGRGRIADQQASIGMRFTKGLGKVGAVGLLTAGLLPLLMGGGAALGGAGLMAGGGLAAGLLAKVVADMIFRRKGKQKTDYLDTTQTDAGTQRHIIAGSSDYESTPLSPRIIPNFHLVPNQTTLPSNVTITDGYGLNTPLIQSSAAIEYQMLGVNKQLGLLLNEGSNLWDRDNWLNLTRIANNDSAFYQLASPVFVEIAERLRPEVVPPILLPTPPPGSYAKGGVIPKVPGVSENEDNVPFRGTPGEIVLNKKVSTWFMNLIGGKSANLKDQMSTNDQERQSSKALEITEKTNESLGKVIKEDGKEQTVISLMRDTRDTLLDINKKKDGKSEDDEGGFFSNLVGGLSKGVGLGAIGAASLSLLKKAGVVVGGFSLGYAVGTIIREYAEGQRTKANDDILKLREKSKENTQATINSRIVSEKFPQLAEADENLFPNNPISMFYKPSYDKRLQKIIKGSARPDPKNIGDNFKEGQYKFIQENAQKIADFGGGADFNEFLKSYSLKRGVTPLKAYDSDEGYKVAKEAFEAFKKDSDVRNLKNVITPGNFIGNAMKSLTLATEKVKEKLTTDAPWAVTPSGMWNEFVDIFSEFFDVINPTNYIDNTKKDLEIKLEEIKKIEDEKRKKKEADLVVNSNKSPAGPMNRIALGRIEKEKNEAPEKAKIAEKVKKEKSYIKTHPQAYSRDDFNTSSRYVNSKFIESAKNYIENGGDRNSPFFKNMVKNYKKKTGDNLLEKLPAETTKEKKQYGINEVREAIQKASDSTGVPFDYLASLGKQESDFGQDPETGPRGIFQMSTEAWFDAWQYHGGIKNKDRLNPYDNALGAAYLHQRYKPTLPDEFKNDPTAWYLLHFFGSGDGPKFFNNFREDPNKKLSDINLNRDIFDYEANENLLQDKDSPLGIVYKRVKDLMRRVAGRAGVSDVFANTVTLGDGQQFARGGVIPRFADGNQVGETSTSPIIPSSIMKGIIPQIQDGSLDEDSTLVAAQPGELILPKKLSGQLINFFKKVISDRKFSGKYKFGGSIPKFGEGGKVGGKSVGGKPVGVSIVGAELSQSFIDRNKWQQLPEYPGIYVSQDTIDKIKRGDASPKPKAKVLKVLEELKNTTITTDATNSTTSAAENISLSNIKMDNLGRPVTDEYISKGGFSNDPRFPNIAFNKGPWRDTPSVYLNRWLNDSDNGKMTWIENASLNFGNLELKDIDRRVNEIIKTLRSSKDIEDGFDPSTGAPILTLKKEIDNATATAAKKSKPLEATSAKKGKSPEATSIMAGSTSPAVAAVNDDDNRDFNGKQVISAAKQSAEKAINTERHKALVSGNPLTPEQELALRERLTKEAPVRKTTAEIEKRRKEQLNSSPIGGLADGIGKFAGNMKKEMGGLFGGMSQLPEGKITPEQVGNQLGNAMKLMGGSGPKGFLNNVANQATSVGGAIGDFTKRFSKNSTSSRNSVEPAGFESGSLKRGDVSEESSPLNDANSAKQAEKVRKELEPEPAGLPNISVNIPKSDPPPPSKDGKYELQIDPTLANLLNNFLDGTLACFNKMDRGFVFGGDEFSIA